MDEKVSGSPLINAVHNSIIACAEVTKKMGEKCDDIKNLSIIVSINQVLANALETAVRCEIALFNPYSKPTGDS